MLSLRRVAVTMISERPLSSAVAAPSAVTVCAADDHGLETGQSAPDRGGSDLADRNTRKGPAD